jgi:hypothetical protein
MRTPSRPPFRFSLRSALIATTCLAVLAAFLGRFADRPYILHVGAILVGAYVVPFAFAMREGLTRTPSGITATVILGLGLMLVAGAWRELPSVTAGYRNQLRSTELVGVLCVVMAAVIYARRRT